MSRASITGVRGTAVDQIKDPRPLRDKAWQQNTNKNIVDYLTNAGYSLPLSTKTLQMPTSKDFQTIFKFLCAKIDPNFVFQKKFEEEVPVVLKALKLVSHLGIPASALGTSLSPSNPCSGGESNDTKMASLPL
ncbi:MAG: HEC/Ndc80p family-domain-containing protein [Olpidium bornovanus]|uniref:Kinetochore protein NDC80 n=1 Tax=Olpidium bornovanus TaxID=278681 RepID=A0A8H7ZY75_9FUNG|nr:MAG: HEC/Ndc80p family-domain-containing protein [Olpidium bornovanus]